VADVRCVTRSAVFLGRQDLCALTACQNRSNYCGRFIRESFMRILPTGHFSPKPLALHITLALLALNLANIACVQAETRPMPWEATPPPHVIEDRLRLDVSVWNMNVDSFLRADPTPSQPGTSLDGESDVGLAKNSVRPDIELALLPGKRQLIRINGFSSRRSGTAVLTQDIKFDDQTYRTNQLVKSTLNLDMLGVGYAYRLLKAPRYELDLGLDVQIASVEANVFTPGFQREADEGVVPIPLLDAEGRWDVWRKWQLVGRYRWLSAHGNDVKGSVADWRAGVQWQYDPHLAIGLHYRSFNISVDSSSNSHPGAVRLDYKGLQLGVRASM
jgi:hypothetical protein